MRAKLTEPAPLSNFLPGALALLVNMKLFILGCSQLTESQRTKIEEQINNFLTKVQNWVSEEMENRSRPLILENQQLKEEKEKLISDFDKQTLKLKAIVAEKNLLQQRMETLKKSHREIPINDRKVPAGAMEMFEQDISDFVFGFSNKIRNFFGICQSYIELLLQRKDVPPNFAESIKTVLSQIERLGNALQEIQEFTKPTIPFLKAIALSKLLDKTISMISHIAENQKVDIQTSYSSDTPLVFVDEKLTLEVFLQVALNAIESMPEGGILSISTVILKEKNMVNVIFSDTGLGIAPPYMTEVGKPFFTTKENSMGLGLAKSKKLLAAIGGTFSILNSSKIGTKVCVSLPLK